MLKSTDRLQKNFSSVWATVNLATIRHNYQEIKKMTTAKIMAVVKSDAYGHGLLPIAEELVEQGVDQLAVATVDEGLQLRQHGIQTPILVFGNTHPADMEPLIRHDLMQAVFYDEMIDELAYRSSSIGQPAKIHLKLDTGLGRIGYPPHYPVIYQTMQRIQQSPNVHLKGIYTQLSSAHVLDHSSVWKQSGQFISITERLEQDGFTIPDRHLANSSTFLNFPGLHLDIVRPGILLYGAFPSQDITSEALSLQPAMTVKTQVIFLKDVEAGTSIGYGSNYVVSRKSRIATLSVGFANGYNRHLTNTSSVLLHGKLAPLVGSIYMNHCTIDVTDIPQASLWDEVILFGPDHPEINITALAEQASTVNTELLSLIGSRLDKIYIDDNTN
ncbi:alanine racemase [Marininema mesophilum]|uniref:Alanine racemase n=1 Tax=Marininema mesophilum TaxID=1048340 RepID=A0A1H3ATK2_9BACL|nr:alanine racemase [Marininema mesophilum]SDX33016.1 alanine racemase [Marininema mesophilum]